MAAGANSLTRARSLLAEVKRDPNKRRYRHHWERAILALERTARGRDAPVALLEAARARYGLYRFSAVEADRDAALALAGRADRAGSREAASFIAAIHREAGDTELASAKASKARAKKRTPRPAAATSSASNTAGGGAGAPDEEEETSDPILEDSATGAGDIIAEERKDEVSGAAAGGPARISEIKTWSNAEYTRVAVYLSKNVAWQREELASEGDRPRRLVLDFKPSLLEGKAAATPVDGAQVQRVRIAQFDPETVRVVLDLAGNDAYQLFRLDGPPRLIVDVGTREPHGEAPTANGSPSAEDPTSPAPPLPKARPGGEEVREEQAEQEIGVPERQAIRRVVIDAGHGGHDTGAIGPTGVREKTVALAMAERLSRKLRAAGFETVLTRRNDTFLRLEERTAIANAAHGDLFISLHANAHPRRDRKGIETYFLNVADGRYAARLAARENGVLALEGAEAPQVQRILSDLDANASTASSQRLARLVQRELCVGVRSRMGEVRDLGVKSALFYVLLGARMPAVLVETAFISNRTEEQRLTSASYQEEIAGDLTRAIAAYAGREPRLATVR